MDMELQQAIEERTIVDTEHADIKSKMETAKLTLNKRI